MADRNPYMVLGVDARATPEEIKRAYRKMSVRYHPDMNPDDIEASAKFRECSEAYEFLSDPQKKLGFDKRSGLTLQHGAIRVVRQFFEHTFLLEKE